MSLTFPVPNKKNEGRDRSRNRAGAAEASSRVAELAADFNFRGALLPLLHTVQAEFGYIDDAIVPDIADALNLSRADVHGVITFYHDFRRQPPARHIVQFCRAESCQARGGVEVEQWLANRLGVAMGTARGDGQVALKPVYCLGLCATGPNALVDGVPVSRIDKEVIDDIARKVAA